jgi:hypothetical protein
VRELFATDFAVATGFTVTETNQGLQVDNEYRQSGLVKNLTAYDSNLRYSELSGTACFLITGDFAAGVNYDQIIFGPSNKRYRVVTFTDQSLLVQSLDNSELVAGNMVNIGTIQTPISVTLTSVTNPTIDKYSGEMMSLGNSDLFELTDEQTVLIKTVIRL